MIENYKNILDNTNFVFVDIGSRGGVSNEWKNVRNLIQVVLFEPDEVEATRLKSNSSENEIVIPKAVWNQDGEVTFHTMRNSSYSSILEPDKEVLNGTYYYCRNFYEIDKTIDIEVNVLENILNQYSINNIDFLKIDIQGGEHYILETIKNWETIAGIHTEAYGSKLYKNGSDISSTLNIMYKKKYELYDLKVIADAPIVKINNQYVFSKNLLNARPKSGYNSRPMVYDLLLLKNRIDILDSNDKTKIRKMIFVLCVYKYFDYALNLIIKSFDQNIFTEEEKHIIIESIKNLHNASLSKSQKLKEYIRAPSYNLRKR